MKPIGPKSKEEEKLALIISNFYATSNLYLGFVRRPEPFVHVCAGGRDAESQQPAVFGIKIRFGVEMTEVSQPVFKNLLLYKALRGGAYL
jgi:hypothetical protein